MTVYEVSLLKAMKDLEYAMYDYKDAIDDYMSEIDDYYSQKMAEEVLGKRMRITEVQLLDTLSRIQNEVKTCKDSLFDKFVALANIIENSPENTTISSELQTQFNLSLKRTMRTYKNIFADIKDLEDEDYANLLKADFGLYDLNIIRGKLDYKISEFNRKFGASLLLTLQAAKFREVSAEEAFKKIEEWADEEKRLHKHGTER